MVNGLHFKDTLTGGVAIELTTFRSTPLSPEPLSPLEWFNGFICMYFKYVYTYAAGFRLGFYETMFFTPMLQVIG